MFIPKKSGVDFALNTTRSVFVIPDGKLIMLKQTDEIQRKQFRTVKTTTILFNFLITPLVVLGLFMNQGPMVVVAIIYVLLVNTNLWYYLRTRNFIYWSTSTLVLLGMICWYSFYHGGVDGAGMFWAFIFPFLAYEFKGFIRGSRFIFPFVLGLLGIYLLSLFGPFPQLYAPRAIFIYFLVLTGVIGFLYVFDKRKTQSEDAIHDREDKFGALVTSLSDLVYTLDLEQKFTGVYGNWIPVAANNPESYIGKTIKHVLGKDHAELIEESNLRALNGETAVYDWFVGKSPNRTCYQTSVSPLRNSSGVIIGLVGLGRDITHQKKTEESLKQMNERFDQISRQNRNIAWEVDAKGLYAFINPVVLDVLGYMPEELIGKKYFYEIHPEEGREAFKDKVLTKLKCRDSISDFVHPVLAKDGSLKWVATYCTPGCNEMSELTGYRGSYRDITESKLMEDKLAYERNLMDMLMGNIPYQIYFKDRQSRFIRVNQLHLDIFGIKDIQEVVGKTDFDFFTDEHARQAFEDEQELMQTGQPIIDKVEKETWQDGTITWVSTSKFPIRNNQGEIIGTFGVSKDITEQRQTVIQLQQSEEKYRLITENAHDVIWIFNFTKEQFTYMSPSVYHLRGYTPEEAMAESLEQSFTHEFALIFKQEMAKSIGSFRENNEQGKQQAIREIQQPCKDGSLIWVEISTQIQENSLGEIEVLGVSRNIDSRKEMEQAIRYQDKMQQLISAVSFEFVASNIENMEEKLQKVLQLAGNFFSFDRSHLFRVSPDQKTFSLAHEWCGPGIESAPEIVPEIAFTDLPWFEEQVKNGKPIYVEDVEQMEAIHEKQHFMLQGIQSFVTFPLMINNELIGLLGFDTLKNIYHLSPEQISVIQLMANIICDAMERNKAEKALSVSEKRSRDAAVRYQAYIDASNTGAWEYNHQKGFMWCSPQYFSILGRQISDFDFSGNPNAMQIWKLLIHPDDFEIVIQDLENYIQKPSGTYQQFFRMLHQNGSYIWILSRGKILDYEDGTSSAIMVGTHIDLTEQKRAEEIIKTKNKELESYLYVASHDLRTPLVNIQGFSSRIQKHMNALKEILENTTLPSPKREKIFKLIEEDSPKSLSFIFTNVKKMDGLINGLLTISRTGRIQMTIKKVNMDDMITRVLAVNSYQLEQIGAHVDLKPLPPCYGDVNLLNQLFSNIINNAVKYRKPDVPLRLTIKGMQKNDTSLYCFKDNGIGINQRNLEKIWDVFYRVDPNSEQAGEGIGLNLATKIVEKHHGKIWAESQEGKGSSFFIQLSAVTFME